MVKLMLLDVVEAGLSPSLGWGILLIILLTCLLEGAVMFLLRYNSFTRSLLHAVIANAGSLVLGFILDRFAHEQMNVSDLPHLLFLLLLTILSEGFILWLLNREKAVSRTALAAVLMNLASYTCLFLYFKFGA